MTEEQARALAAVMFNMIGGSEILFFDLEAYFMSQGCEFVRETKKMFTEFMATAKVLHKQYNRLTKLAVSSAECEKMSPKDGYEYDCNTAARTAWILCSPSARMRRTCPTLCTPTLSDPSGTLRGGTPRRK